MNINTLLQENSIQVNHLLRRYRVFGNPTIETINAAHRQHGAPFMTQLMAILTPTSNFSNIGDMVNPGSFIDTAVKNQQQPQKNKFWSFWDNLLNRVDSTGKAIGQFKYDSAGNAIYTDVETSRQAQTQKMILWVTAVIIVVLVAILIFKNKS